jgi:hypothetical protein
MNMKNRISFFWLILLVFILSPVAGQENSPRAAMEIVRVFDFEITGKGDATEWNTAAWELIPKRNNDKVEYQTHAKVVWSKTGIYFLVRCQDRKITATMQANNLNLWEEDVVEVFLMPDEKYPLYFEYQLSPLNYELTLLIPNLDGNFLGWLPWKYEGERKTRHMTSIQKEQSGEAEVVIGWTAEFFIPWLLMEPLIKSAPLPGNQWRANIYRLDYDEGPTRFSWNPTIRNFHEPHNFGTFIFK